MMCFGWRPAPQGCYREYVQPCPSLTWFLILAAATGVAVITSNDKRRAGK